MLDSATFEFLGRPFTVELTAMFPEQTGSIEYISVTPHYYTFEPESFAEKLKALWGRYFGPDASGRFEDFVDAVDALIEERDAACEDGICQYREEGERWFVCSDEFVNEDTGLRWKLVENKCVSRGVDVDARGETSVRYDADNDDVVIVHRNAEQQWALSVSADALRDLEKEDTDGLHRLAEGITIPDAFNGVDWDDIVFEFPKDVQASGFEKSEPELKRVVTSFVADFLPFVGTGKSLYELVAGVDPITGEEVGRVWAAVGLLGSFVPGGKGVVRGVSRLGKATKKAVEIPSAKIKESQLMGIAEKYLGDNYKEVSPGRYLSLDGSRQFRYGVHEVKKSKEHHAHFEYLKDGKVIENAPVQVIPD